ncbi:MAG TPA: hypothetical protein VHL34_11370 [Rhizomicrobium sp.]|jgi:hypothetical protein|nr:hypothetical protein [Rhizomicrobium sp.]
MSITKRLALFALASTALATGVPTLAGDLHGFTSDKKQDLFGYYMPSNPIRVGQFVLHDLALADEADFKKYEAGGYKGVPYAPVQFDFDDVKSPKKQGELGEYYENRPRILPSAYNVTSNKVTFIGTDKKMGVVTFIGTLDLARLKAIKAGGGDPNAVVLKGDLAIGTQKFPNITFTWFGGD